LTEFAKSVDPVGNLDTRSVSKGFPSEINAAEENWKMVQGLVNAIFLRSFF
jgi:hypothetical protein